MKNLAGIILVISIVMSCIVMGGCSEAEFTDELAKEIKWDYLMDFEITNKSFDDVIIEYVAGQYDGYWVMMIDATSHTPEITTENVAGVDIVYHDNNRLLAWKNGEFFTL